jgi:cellulose synthase/poly-beta-1,6-N-acetylglucosamine synthase-like glycosyltransferase
MSQALLLGGAFIFALFFHPFTTYPLTLWLAKRAGLRSCPVKRPMASISAPLRFSLLTCAYNEERAAHAMAENRLAVAASRHAEILVYDDCSTDRTAEILAAYAPRLALVRANTRTGKTHGMNVLASRAQGDILVFSDANVSLHHDVLERLEWHFRDPAVGCVCGHLIYVNDGESATAATGGLYWRLEERIKALETDTGSTMGADGSLFAARRCLHKAVPPYLIDDIYLSLSILLDGYRVLRAPDALAFERSSARPMDEFRRKARIACQAINVHHALRPRLRNMPLFDRYKYLSHKLLRWLSPFTGLAGTVLTAAGFALALGPLLALALFFFVLSLIALLMVARPRLCGRVSNIFLAFAGVGLGILQSLSGERYQIWTPAASVR